jgi:hypothetical protein
VTLGPYLQHRRVIIGRHWAAGRQAQRRDRHRPGVVGVVLVCVTSREQPHSGAELGRRVQHPLPGGQQLLGQQMPQAAAPSIAQARSGQGAAHASSRCACPAHARTRSSPSTSSAALIATAVCEALCGSTPIITAAMNGPPPPGFP